MTLPLPPRPLCARCRDYPREPGIKYCKCCRREVVAAMQDSGYLQCRPRPAKYRHPEAREKIHETRRGIDE